MINHLLLESIVFQDGEYTIEDDSIPQLDDNLSDTDKFGARLYKLKKNGTILNRITLDGDWAMDIRPFTAQADKIVKKWAITNANVALAYAIYMDMRLPSAEPMILQDIPTDGLVLYARYACKGRWFEAEPKIMQDPNATAWYAHEVINDRWPEAEPIIKQDPEQWGYYLACFHNLHKEVHIYLGSKTISESIIFQDGEYSIQDDKPDPTNTDTDVLSDVDGFGRSIYRLVRNSDNAVMALISNLGYGMHINPSTAECYSHPTIRKWMSLDANRALHYAYCYAGRFLEAESIILQNPVVAAKYAINVLERRWPEAESIIKQDAEAWKYYKEETMDDDALLGPPVGPYVGGDIQESKPRSAQERIDRKTRPKVDTKVKNLEPVSGQHHRAGSTIAKRKYDPRKTATGKSNLRNGVKNSMIRKKISKRMSKYKRLHENRYTLAAKFMIDSKGLAPDVLIERISKYDDPIALYTVLNQADHNWYEMKNIAKTILNGKQYRSKPYLAKMDDSLTEEKAFELAKAEAKRAAIIYGATWVERIPDDGLKLARYFAVGDVGYNHEYANAVDKGVVRAIF